MYQTDAPWSFSAMNSLESPINRHSAIVHWYQQWAPSLGTAQVNPSLLNAAVQHGSAPLITWEPWDGDSGHNPYPLKQITAGAFDTYIDSWATGLKAYGRPLYLAFAHEMEGDWYPWGYGAFGNTAADYIAAYRHVHDRFAAQGAGNVQWVWTPGAEEADSGRPPITDFYPGDSYTDWLGLDAYNQGTTQSWSSWRMLGQVLQPSYGMLQGLSKTKPMMLVEWASVESGGSKAAWVVDAGATLAAQFSQVKATVWFSEKGRQWALDSSSGALQAERTTFGAAPYCATLPY